MVHLIITLHWRGRLEISLSKETLDQFLRFSQSPSGLFFRQNIHRMSALNRLHIEMNIHGYAIFPIHADMVTTLLNSADKALYRAKSEGRIVSAGDHFD
ncbi:MAG: hypothetical protein HQM07_05470 [Zetaproteobacteria bacterium]|nr:hypothetical protein [Zetaproteobacteria bacterium]